MGSVESCSADEGINAAEIKIMEEIKFHIHEKEHRVKAYETTPNTSLNFYLRNNLHMTGTKAMCLEGGCGACVVVLQNKDPVTHKDVFLAVNSCLIPLLSCNGWKILTIEGIGNPIDGYHPVQEVLARFNGTQCGFCSPGMVMNMYALYESGKLTMAEVENSFSGNLCRCTGYRPILSAFKSLCKDASTEVLGECPDMEDFISCYREKCTKKCTKKFSEISRTPFILEFQTSKWIKVHNLKDLLATLKMNSQLSYRLVAGNTAQGVYKSYNTEVQLYIDIADVVELKQLVAEGDNCVVGAGTTLNDTINFFTEVSNTNEKFSYLKAMATHISLVANVPVRNRGTIAGNLMIKHDHHEFPSDIFLTLETVGATVTLVNLKGEETQLSLHDFIIYDVQNQRAVLKNITLKSYQDNVKFISYKIMPRAQNTHAIVNAGFLFKFNENNIIKNATVVYGNINPSFIHATATEKLLEGKNLFDNSILQQVFKSLDKEIIPNVIPPDPSPACRKKIAIALFYKAVLNIAPQNKTSAKYKSGGEVLKRPLSTGVQDYGTNKSMYPLTQPIPKIEALAQTSGIARYVVDMPDLPFQLFGALVLAKAPPNSTIMKINADQALARKDVVAFFSKSDIPGENSFTPKMTDVNSEEEIFCKGTVKFYHQVIGVIIGATQKAADEGAELVEVTYNSPDVQPLVTIREVLSENRTDRITKYKTISPTRKGNDIKHVIKGTCDIYHQYHFHMEIQACLVIPTENTLDVYPSSQWMDITQAAIARMLNISESKINITVRRCGGGFGGKITRASQIACIASLAAWILKKPVKIWLPLTTNMRAIGRRFPFSADYEVGVDAQGKIQYLEGSFYTDCGYQYDEDPSLLIVEIVQKFYTADTFAIDMYRVLTDTACNTWCRAPGSTEAMTTLESIMDHIAYTVNVDPLQVRLSNLSNKTSVSQYVLDMKSWANVDKRKADVSTFNEQNRWKKKGISVSPMVYELFILGPYLVTVSIFHDDGTVQISHGGIEVGQGINTKAAQVCAYMFKIPLEQVTVLPSSSFISANTFMTASSTTSDAVCYGVQQACNELLNRIQPYRKEGVTWKEAVKEAHANFVKLVATAVYSPNALNLKSYFVYGTCCAEVEVDILTGQHIVTRLDLIEDTGITLSPIVDIGQVEGAFIMGLGYQTMEKFVHNYEGEVLTNNTWTYHVPGALDIPVQFNVKFPKNNPNPVGVLKSKGTGEPAFCFGVTVPLAIRNALASARTDSKASVSKWYPIDGTTDVENVVLNTLHDYSEYIL